MTPDEIRAAITAENRKLSAGGAEGPAVDAAELLKAEDEAVGEKQAADQANRDAERRTLDAHQQRIAALAQGGYDIRSTPNPTRI